MSLKDKAIQKLKSKAKSKIRKIAFKILAPFIPYILIIFLLFFSICSIIDAVFVQEVQTDTASLPEADQILRGQCIIKAEYLNTCHNYVDGNITNHLLDKDNREESKQIEWSHLYAIMAFHNMSEHKKIDENLLNEVAKSFESTFKYETMTIKEEKKGIDEDGNEVVVTQEQHVYILVESDTIYGHYKYNYEEKVSNPNSYTTTTTKVFKNEELLGQKYERLEKYLKDKFHIKDEDLDTNLQIILQAANGYYEGEEHLSWLQESGVSYNIITNGESYVPKGMFTWPIPGYTTITSHFGMRIHPITRSI